MTEKLLNNLQYIVLFISIILLTFLVKFLVDRFFKNLINSSTTIMQNDPTNYKFLGHIVNAIIYIVGFSIAIYSMPQLRILASSLLAGAGVLAVAIGFASQQALGNIISGVFVIIFKPFKINDRLKIGDKFGTVEDITLRHTILRDLENKRIIIPNSIISNEVIVNSDFVDDKICKWIEIGIAYDANLDRAKAIIAEEIGKHPLYLDTRTLEDIEEGKALVTVKVISLGEYAVNLRGWSWAKNSGNAFDMACDLYESIKKRLDEEGIEIPFPYRTIVQKN